MNFLEPQQLSLHPQGPSRDVRLAGEGMQLGTAENGVLVLLTSNPGLDEHSFVCTNTPMVTTGPGISAWGWGRFRTRVAAFWPPLTLEWVLDALSFPNSVAGVQGAQRTRVKNPCQVPRFKTTLLNPIFSRFK